MASTLDALTAAACANAAGAQRGDERAAHGHGGGRPAHQRRLPRPASRRQHGEHRAEERLGPQAGADDRVAQPAIAVHEQQVARAAEAAARRRVERRGRQDAEHEDRPRRRARHDGAEPPPGDRVAQRGRAGERRRERPAGQRRGEEQRAAGLRQRNGAEEQRRPARRQQRTRGQQRSSQREIEAGRARAEPGGELERQRSGAGAAYGLVGMAVRLHERGDAERGDRHHAEREREPPRSCHGPILPDLTAARQYVQG